MSKRRFKLLLLICLFGGIGISALPLTKAITTRLLYSRWDPEKALTEAQEDISRGKIKIYIHGTESAQAVGVDPSQLSLIQGIPTKQAGVGCIVSDWTLRKRQGEYAVRYNTAIVQYLKKRSN